MKEKQQIRLISKVFSWKGKQYCYKFICTGILGHRQNEYLMLYSVGFVLLLLFWFSYFETYVTWHYLEGGRSMWRLDWWWYSYCHTKCNWAKISIVCTRSESHHLFLNRNLIENFSFNSHSWTCRNNSYSWTYLYLQQVPFEVLVRRQISRLLDPSLQCARFIYDELIKVGGTALRFAISTVSPHQVCSWLNFLIYRWAIAVWWLNCSGSLSYGSVWMKL